jgi:site-specific DNA recombinase
VKSYAEDLKSLLGEAAITESKSFLRSFIKRIEVNKSEALIHYALPVPSCRGDMQSAVVLPIDNFGGAGGVRTPYLLNAIQALSQMSYSPTR